MPPLIDDCHSYSKSEANVKPKNKFDKCPVCGAAIGKPLIKCPNCGADLIEQFAKKITKGYVKGS